MTEVRNLSAHAERNASGMIIVTVRSGIAQAPIAGFCRPADETDRLLRDARAHFGAFGARAVRGALARIGLDP